MKYRHDRSMGYRHEISPLDLYAPVLRRHALLFHGTWFLCERNHILSLRKNSLHHYLTVPLWFGGSFCKLINNGLFCTRCNQQTQVEHTKSNYSLLLLLYATCEIIGNLCLVLMIARSSGSNKIIN